MPSRPSASLRKSLWWLVGLAGVIAAFLIMAFYTEVAGWVFAYIFEASGGGVLSTDPAVTSNGFADLISSPWQSLIWQWIVLIWVAGIILFGVSKGIERMTKRLLPLLFLLLVIVGIRSVTLPGGAEGLKFLFRPDFSQITWQTVLVAMGLAFFKLSVGMGTMITYGSYFRKEQSIPGTATRVMLAGIAIFPAVFAYGFEPASGPSLLFITISAVFSSMPGGAVFRVLFFILAAVAATGAMLSLFEVPVAFLDERCNMSRTTATIITPVALAAVGSTAALSSSTMADFRLFGMTMFDLFDYATSNVLLPLGGLLICLFVGWRWGWSQVKRDLSNGGTLNNERVARLFFGVAKFVTSVLVFIVLLNGLGVIG